MKKTITIVVALIILVVIIAAFPIASFINQTGNRFNTMKKLTLAFTMYTNESKGEIYPPATPYLKMANLDAFIGEYAGHDKDIAAYLGGKMGVDICYTGYTMLNETMALVLLDHIEQKGKIPGYFIEYKGIIGSLDDMPRSSTIITPLREGIQRAYIDEINYPPGGEKAKHRLPVFWEMPDNQYPPGGWVQYMDGTAEWLPYPGRFPMTPSLIKKARTIMGESESHWTISDLFAALILPKPLYADNDIEAILYALNDTPVSTSSSSFLMPSPHENTQDVWKINNLNPQDASGTIRYVSGKGELALVPEKENPDLAIAEKIFTQFRENCRKQFMGKGDGYVWYANLPDALANELISRFYLHRGDIKRNVVNLHDNFTIFLLPDDLLDKYKTRWLSENPEEKVSEIPEHLQLINTPESMALLHEGLKPSSPYFFRNFRTAMSVEGIFEEYYGKLDFDQRIELVAEPTFGIAYANNRIPAEKLKLLEPYAADVVMSALDAKLGSNKRKSHEWESLEIQLRLRPDHPENFPCTLDFEEKIRLTYLRLMLDNEWDIKNELCKFSFLKDEPYNKVIKALKDYQTDDKERGETIKRMIDLLFENPNALTMTCE